MNSLGFSVLISDKICINTLSSQQELLNFKNSKFAQILRVDKTCFLRPGHIFYRAFIACSISAYTASNKRPVKK